MSKIATTKTLTSGSSGRPLLLLFSVTLFVAAALLFLVEPMFAKMVLWRLGGTPAVWNTCMVFYQTLLLAGYLYAHFSIRRLGARRQAVLHLVVSLLPWLVLPLAVRAAPPGGLADPVRWLLGTMAVSVGLPFFVVAAAAPMLQAWFVETGHPAAKDPYFLYAASNLGSMVGLLGYPLVVEPMFGLAEQAVVWSAGYGVLAVLTLCCAAALWRARGPALPAIAPAEPAAALPLGWGTRLRWIVLALVPSSLLLGVTTYISTDITVVPLLWVVPLALYLLSFVLVFSRRQILGRRVMLWAQAVLVAATMALYHHVDVNVYWWKVLLHLGAFFTTAMVCHGELARSRPAARHLTEFYIWISVGGMLGGWFNALLAPVVFPWVIEYPLAIVAACLLRPAIGPALGRGSEAGNGRRAGWRSDVLVPGLLAAIVFGVVFNLMEKAGVLGRVEVSRALYWTALAVQSVFALAVALWFSRRPLRYGIGIAGLLATSAVVFPAPSRQIGLPMRNFFGVIRLRYSPYADAFAMVHGTTNHGMQSRDPELRLEPLTYFYRTGPLGEIFAAIRSRRRPIRTGIVGLGAGSMACYGEPGERWTFYELNPLVAQLARESFSYLEGSKAEYEVVLGDARIGLERTPDGEFDILCLDAFSSDNVPLHLLTREAIALYFRKVKADGLVALHVSNNYLVLARPLAQIAEVEGLVCRMRMSDPLTDDEEKQGKFSNTWVIMARDARDLGPIAANPKWRQPLPLAGRVWTDDYSNILSALP